MPGGTRWAIVGVGGVLVALSGLMEAFRGAVYDDLPRRRFWLDEDGESRTVAIGGKRLEKLLERCRVPSEVCAVLERSNGQRCTRRKNPWEIYCYVVNHFTVGLP